MSIATTVRTAGPFAGTGSLVALPFAFKVFTASDLVVQRTNVAGDVATLTLTTHYSVSLNADQATSPGGTVTLVTALAVGETAALTSSVSATQPLQLASGGPFLPGQIEDALDRAMIVVQQQGVLGEQTLRVPLGETALILPIADQRANKALLFDADGDPYLAAPASGSAADLALSIASTDAGKGAALVGSNDAGGYFDGTNGEAILQELGRSRKLLEVYADIPADGSDQYTALAALLASAKLLDVRLRLPAGIIGFSDTLTIDFCLELVGPGRDICQLNFLNSTPGKPAIKFVNGSAKSKVSGFTLTDQTFGTSSGIVFIDSAGASGGPVWKNTFEAIEIVGFSGSHVYTTANPLAGATHTHCSENRWINCRFANNLLTCLNQNCQAVNNTYIGCDFENFDTTYHGGPVVDANWQFFKDEAGGGVVILGGSLIGRGRWFGWEYKTGGTTLFSGGEFKMQGVRVEARSTHVGACIQEDVHGVTGGLSLDITVRDVSVIAYGQNLDLLRYGGRVDATIDNVTTIQGTGTLFVRQYPTIGRTSNTTTASQGIVHITNSAVKTVVETTSPYGTYNANYTGQIIRDGCVTSSTNASMATDAQGWFSASGSGNAQQLGFQINDAVNATKLLWNNDSPGSTVAGDVKIAVPAGARPLELVVFKQPQAVASDSGWELYVVKDNASWANPAAFAIGTDATLVATTGVTTNKAGFFRVPVVLTVAGFTGNELRAGKTGWLEGRLYFKKTGATAFPGWFGVEYI